MVKRPDAVFLNKKLMALFMEYDALLDEIPHENMTATEVKKELESLHSRTDYVKDYAKAFIERLEEQGRHAYALNMSYTVKYLLECFGENFLFSLITPNVIKKWEEFLFKKGLSSTTVNIRMSNLKTLLNTAVNEGMVEYKIFPFKTYRMPHTNIRDICISKRELALLRDFDPSAIERHKCATQDSTKRLSVARDLFMLSFYCAGINLTDLMDADVTKDELTFVRKKTADKKQGEKQVSITIQPEAREIIERYLGADGKMHFGYHFSKYEQFRSFVTKSLNRIGEILGFEKKLMFYSARKTFCQFGFEIGVPLYILEYAIGQTIKDANNRPIFNYIKIMRKQADEAIRSIIDHSMSDEAE